MLKFNDFEPMQYTKNCCVLYNSRSKTESLVLSNFYSCNLIWNRRTYRSLEHLFFSLLLSGNTDAQTAINVLPFAYQAKKKGEYLLGEKDIKGKKIKGHVEDYDKRIAILHFCMRLKYIQCREFRTFLERSENKPLVEYAPWGDDKYGCVDTDSEYRNYWTMGFVRGCNVSGRLLEAVREEGKSGYIHLEIPCEGLSLFGQPLMKRDYWVKLYPNGGYEHISGPSVSQAA